MLWTNHFIYDAIVSCFCSAKGNEPRLEDITRNKSVTNLVAQRPQHVLCGVRLSCTHRVPLLPDIGRWVRNLASSYWVMKGKDNQWVVIHMYTYGGYATQWDACLWPRLRRAWIVPVLSLLLSWLSFAALLVVCCTLCRCFSLAISWLFFKWLLSRGMEGPHMGTSALTIFLSKQQMALLLSVWSRKKNPTPGMSV